MSLLFAVGFFGASAPHSGLGLDPTPSGLLPTTEHPEFAFGWPYAAAPLTSLFDRV